LASPNLVTIRDQIAWSYANLARCHAAISEGRTKYVTTDHMIRAKLFKGLRTGKMAIGSIYDDERHKYLADRACAYCGDLDRLSVDHIIARVVGGGDDGANLVLACRSCNSSKGDLDLLEWLEKRGTFPSLMVLRRYTKLVAIYCDQRLLLDCSLVSAPDDLPFDLQRLPHVFPALSELRL
jgi:HNH endonuclease